MENLKHTKGEWYYVDGNDSSCEVNVGETVVSICRWEKNSGIMSINREEMEANAKIISAAPDLLEALIEAKELIGNFRLKIPVPTQDVWEKIDNAINKATK